jgi:hypothetical protein
MGEYILLVYPKKCQCCQCNAAKLKQIILIPMCVAANAAKLLELAELSKRQKVNRVGKNFAELAKTLQNLDCLTFDRLSDNILSAYNTLESGWWYQLDGAVAGNYMTVDSAVP